VNAIYGAGIDTSGVFHPDAGLGNDICHRLPPTSKLCSRREASTATAVCCLMVMTVEKISAITFRVVDMDRSVQFYQDVLGMELLYGGETAGFSSVLPTGFPA